MSMHQMTSHKKQNAGSIQSWLYAMINKTFGKQAVIERDPLHKRYELHKHDFYVTGIDQRFLLLHLQMVLEDVGYKQDDSHKFADLLMTQTVHYGNETRKYIVSIKSGERGLCVSPKMYQLN